MTDINVAFCRSLLREGIAEVKKHFPDLRLKDAWVYKVGNDHWEFHGPDEYYWHGSASNAYDARYNGWMAWLRFKGVEGHTIADVRNDN